MVVGTPLAWLMARAVASALGLFEPNTSLIQAGGVASLLVLVALISAWLPARRASGLSPQTALREE